MDDASGMERCPRCGAEFTPAATPLGLCPACLLKLGMSDPAMSVGSMPRPDDEPAAPIAAPDSTSSQGLSEHKPTAPLHDVRRRRFGSRAWIAAVFALAVVMAAFAMFLTVRVSNRPGASVVRFSLSAPRGTQPVDGAQFAVSPDGTQVALAARSEGGQPRLWIRRLQTLEWRELPRTDGAAFPFWSPDSRFVGFFAERSLKTIDVATALIRTLCDASPGRGGTWGIQGLIVFAASAAGPLSRVPASGGVPQPATTLDPVHHEVAHLWPHFLPDGRHFVFFVHAGPTRGTSATGTYLGSLETGDRTLLAAGSGPSAVAADVLLFSRQRTLMAQGLDRARMRLIGDAQSIGGADEAAGPVFAVSDTVLVHGSGRRRLSQLTWFDFGGRAIGSVGEPAGYESMTLSPDGKTVAVARRNAQDDRSSIWLMESGESGSDRVIRLTASSGSDGFPVWSPDRSRVAFASRRDDADGLYDVVVNGGGKEDALLQSGESKRPLDWSRDDRFLIYSARAPKNGTDLWALPLKGDRKPFALYPTAANESDGRLSPDGRWLAYVSDQSGSEEIHVRPFPPSDGLWQISTTGGTRPRWRADGRALYFVAPDGLLMAVEVVASPAFQAGSPRALFSLRGADDFEISQAGHFLVMTPVHEDDENRLQVVLNWKSELR